MKEITPQNVHSICLTCLVELEETSSPITEKFNIQEHKFLQELITFCISMPVEASFKFPEFVCRTCYEMLQSFHEFRCQSIHSIRKLNFIIKELKEKKIGDESQGSEIKCDVRKKDMLNTRDSQDLRSVDLEKYPNQPRSKKKLQTCIASMVVKFPQEPNDCTLTQLVKSEEMCGETDEIEINYSDAEIELQDSVDALNFSATTRIIEDLKEVQDIKDLDSSIESLPTQNTEYPKSKNACFDVITRVASKNKNKQNSKKSKKIKIANETETHKTGNAKFQCELCPRRCVTFENYEAHLRTHQGLKPFACKECGRSFNKSDRCRAHVREVHGPVALQYVCSYEGCDKVFKRKGTYQMHCRIKHKYADREPKKLICEECGKTFKNGTKLKEHHYKHLPVEQYPFKCDECGKRYRSKCTFKEHQLRHSGIKKFICTYCGMKKPTVHELRAHINYHTKEKQWPCSKCTSVFNSSANLGRHDRVVHQGIRQYACSYCDESFGKRDTLKHHEMRHTGEKPHRCNICDKRFIQAVALRAHMRVHNKDLSRTSCKLPTHKGKPEKEKEDSNVIESIVQSENVLNASSSY